MSWSRYCRTSQMQAWRSITSVAKTSSTTSSFVSSSCWHVSSAISRQRDCADAESLLPELLAHPAWGISGEELWKVSLSANKERISWLEYLQKTPRFETLHEWLVDSAAKSLVTPLEPMLDHLLGVPSAEEASLQFSTLRLPFLGRQPSSHPERYIELLTALSTIRDKLREHSEKASHKLSRFPRIPRPPARARYFDHSRTWP